MKHRIDPKYIFGLALIAICMPRCDAQDGISALLARLSSGDSSLSVLFSLESQPPDPRIFPALEAAFARGRTTEEKQWVAATLIRLRADSRTYFDYLAGLAREAVDDRAPFFLKYDAAGDPVRGEFDAGFLNWCAVNKKNAREVAKIQFGEYVNDVRILAYAQDARAGIAEERFGINEPGASLLFGRGARTIARLGILAPD
jgi:hypothetical protein